MNNDELFIQTLKHYFGYESFRSIQLDIIRSIYEGNDTLGLMPTGGGKSITFQVPALIMDGVCLVVTPLISLMKDQVEHLKEKGIKAEAIHSGLTHDEIQRILDNAIYGAVKFLYVSPERLQSPLFLAKLQYMNVCFITVDEAHCISQWGYDFRPAYLQICEIRQELPATPVLALTATATPTVIDDIQQKLEFGKYTGGRSQFFKMSFRRDNLSYVVRKTDDKFAELLHILESVSGSSIIYTRNRKRTKELSEWLVKQGVSAIYYHAGLDIAIKNTHQMEWIAGKYRVMVATNAFGMGIDKPDVRLVIHLDCPDSIEAYFQEAGRAGRDGLRSYAVLLYNASDRVKLMKHLSRSFPQKDYIRRVYDQLAYYFEIPENTGEGLRYEFNERMFCVNFRHHPAMLYAALSILQNAGYIAYDPEPDNQPRVMFSLMRHQLDEVRGFSQQEDAVVEALLRYYGSLFSELTFINLGQVAKRAGVAEGKMHLILKSLAQKHIIRYVPRRDVPVITYLQQRIASQHLLITKNVYEELQERMKERIDALLRYAETTDVCRSTLLLEYFGEYDAPPCKHCDVCLNDNGNDNGNHNRVMELLADGKEHHISEIKNLGIPEAELDSDIEELREAELVTISYPYIKIVSH